MPGLNIGGSLASYGQDQKREAVETLGKAADQESQRNQQNKQMAAQRKAGGQQLGATTGAMYGSTFGPWGTVIGGVVGAIAGGELFGAWLVGLLVVSLALSPQPAEAHMITKPNLTQMELHQVLNYDPDVGTFTWLVSVAQRMKPGDRAGFEKIVEPDQNGYRYIKVGSVAYAEHRLAWLFMTGLWPEHEIDHINRVKSDNRFENLRQVTRKQNSENRKVRKGAVSNFRGVSWVGGKWQAKITHFGNAVMLGNFKDIEQAKAARLAAEEKLFTHSNRSV